MRRPAFLPRHQRLLMHALMALLLLFMQQQATLHWLSHAVDATHASVKHPLPAAGCDECVGMAAFGAAAPVTSLVLPAVPATHERAQAAQLASIATALRLAFRSRAPPVLS